MTEMYECDVCRSIRDREERAFVKGKLTLKIIYKCGSSRSLERHGAVWKNITFDRKCMVQK